MQPVITMSQAPTQATVQARVLLQDKLKENRKMTIILYTDRASGMEKNWIVSCCHHLHAPRAGSTRNCSPKSPEGTTALRQEARALCHAIVY